MRTVDVTITGTNDGPIVAATDVTGAVTELATPSGNLTDRGTIAFSDVDLADTHSVGPVTPSAGALGSLTASVTTPASDVDGSGGGISWNYTVAASAVEYLAAGQTKLESFTFTLSDGQGGTVDRTVDVTITGTNDGPIVAATDVTGAVTKLGPRRQSHRQRHDRVQRRGPRGHPQRRAGDAERGSPGRAHGERDDAGQRRGRQRWRDHWDYTVAAAAVEYLAAGQTKLETFTFTLSDGKAARSIARWTSRSRAPTMARSWRRPT